ncbi:MAG: response regulator transcription factor [Chloroflexota bacterium]|nr:response regulator transcription factor [Chloroflexota bacterium]
MEPLILVVDDNEDVAETIERTLEHTGFNAVVAHRGADALEVARQRHPDLVVLDIMMPGMSGIDVCRHLRSNRELRDVPILFLTAKAEIGDKIEGFEAGGDDYLTKPFNLIELELRVKALLRRREQMKTPEGRDKVEAGPLVLDCRVFELTTPDRTILLTPVEFELMHFLMSHPGRVFSAEQLLQEVWGYPPGTGMPDLVRVHVKNIRDKIEPDAGEPVYLVNILRRGYMVPSDTW